MMYGSGFTKRAEKDSRDFISKPQGYSPFARRILNEYVFQTMVFDINNRLKADEHPQLTMAHAYALHEKLLDSDNFDMNNMDANSLLTAMRAFAQQEFGYDDLQSLSNDGFARTRADLFANSRKGYAMISPFDERFCFSSWALSSNGEMFYAHIGNNQQTGNGIDNFCTTRFGAFLNDDGSLSSDLSRVGLYSAPDVPVEAVLGRDPQTGEMMREHAALSTEADVYGLSLLHNYIPVDNPVAQDELDKWVIAGDAPMSSAGVNRAILILNHLNDLGIDYTIEPDRNRGQLCAVCNNGVHFRIFETRKNEHLVGRAYNNGIAYFISTDEKIPEYRVGNDGKYERDARGNKIPVQVRNRDRVLKQRMVPSVYRMSDDEALSLVDYALGRDREDSVFGKQGTYDVKEFTNGSFSTVTRNKTYFSQTRDGSSVNFRTVLSSPRYRIVRNGNEKPIYAACDIEGNPAQYPDGRYVKHYSSTRVFLSVTGHRSQYGEDFDAESAETYVREGLESARRNFIDAVNVDYLLDEADKVADSSYYPVFAVDSTVSELQEAFWQLIRQAQEKDGAEYDREYSKNVLMKHLQNEIVDEYIGYFNSPDDCEFNPILTTRYMDSRTISVDTRTRFTKALLTLGVGRDKFKGNETNLNTFSEGLVEFDETSARSLSSMADSYPEGSQKDFVNGIYDAVKHAVETSGCIIDDPSNDILIDKNGIIEYRIKKLNGRSTNTAPVPVVGHIGQVFIPDGMGVVTTAFNRDDNYLFVPGYEGRIIPQVPGENKSFEERTRVSGYLDALRNDISFSIRSNLLSDTDNPGVNTCLNRVYRRLRSERYPLDKFETLAEEGLDLDFFKARLKTQGNRVHFSKAFREGAMIDAEIRFDNAQHDGLVNDLNIMDMFVRTGFENFAILPDNGYFSSTMTSSGASQGINRYISDGARVLPDGSIRKAERSPDDVTDPYETALMKFVPFSKHDTADRQQMDGSALNTCRTSGVLNVAYMNGIALQDDSAIFRDRAANQLKVRGADGEMRPLRIGDKVSQKHGNKGTIGLIINPGMSDYAAIGEGVFDFVQLFKNNPDLDAIFPHEQFISRYSGGNAREAMSHEVRPLVLNDGRVIEGGICSIDVLVQDQTVDSKYHAYGNGASGANRNNNKNGKEGRSFSPQASLACRSAGADDVVREIKSTDTDSFGRIRELMIPLGVDIDEYAYFRIGYHSHNNENRNIIRQPEIIYDENGDVDYDAMDDVFMSQISSKGGFMEIPFQLTLKSGIPIDESYDDSGHPNGMYLLPLLPPYLREGVDQHDDDIIYHTYTHQYREVFRQSIAYRVAEQENSMKSELKKQDALTKATNSYNMISEDIHQRAFHHKYGIFKSLLGRRVPNSITSVVINNPRASLDEVWMSSEMGEHLGITDGDYVLIGRDPIISDGGIRYMKAHFSSEYKEVLGINPLVADSFQADFDGDTLFAMPLNTVRGKASAAKHLTMEANLLNKNYRAEDGLYDLYFNLGLGMQEVFYHFPELKERCADIRRQANENDALSNTGNVEDYAEYLRRNRELLEELGTLCVDAQSKEHGCNVIDFSSLPKMLESVCEPAITGAKGSLEKGMLFARMYGTTVETTEEDGKICGINYDSAVDHEQPLSTEKDHEDSQFATSTKSQKTASAGKILQNAASKCFHVEVGDIRAMKAAMELTSGVTQSLLQIKHDPDRARIFANYLSDNGAAKVIWRGKPIHRVTKSMKKTVTDLDGNVRVTEEDVVMWEADKSRASDKLSPTEWKKMFVDFYTSGDGFGLPVNPEYVDVLAEVMSKTDNQGHVYIDSLNELDDNTSELLGQAFSPSFDRLVKHIESSGGRLNLYGINENALSKAVKGKDTPECVAEAFEDSLQEDSNAAYIFAPNVVLWNLMHKVAPDAFNKVYSQSKQVRRYMVNDEYKDVSFVPKASEVTRPRPQISLDSINFDTIAKSDSEKDI